MIKVKGLMYLSVVAVIFDWLVLLCVLFLPDIALSIAAIAGALLLASPLISYLAIRSLRKGRLKEFHPLLARITRNLAYLYLGLSALVLIGIFIMYFVRTFYQ